MSLNVCIIQGRLGRDPELRRTQSGKAVVNFPVAVDRDVKSGDGSADWINCVAWEQTAEHINRWFSKGDGIIANGRLQARDYTDKDGNKRTSLELVVGRAYFSGGKSKAQNNETQADEQDFSELPEDNGDLPF